MKAELHCHSLYSHDCKMKIKDIFKMADKRNLDFISITDHSSVKSQKKAKNISKDYNVTYIPGVEIERIGHILAYGIEKIPYGSFEEVLEYIKDNNGFFIAAHPYGELFRPSFEKKDLKKFDALETLNGMSFNRNNKKAEKIATKLNKTKVSGSDAHFLEDVGRFACELKGNGFFDSLRKGKVKVPNKKTHFFELLSKRLVKRFY